MAETRAGARKVVSQGIMMRRKKDSQTNARHRLPRQRVGVWPPCLRRQPPRWPVSGLAALLSPAFPGACFRAPSGFEEWKWRQKPGLRAPTAWPLRGQRRWRRPVTRRRLLLPVELRRVNHGASTNAPDFRRTAAPARWLREGSVFPALRVARHTRQRAGGHIQSPAMSAPSPIDQIAERVERLLVRHEEVQRTNALLQEQVEALTRERDALKSRLAAARTRIDAMLERLPEEPPATE